jgi:hypothetical protein
MPNWCSNRLDIYGPSAVVDHFLAVFRASGFAGHKAEPDDADTDPQDDWYGWRKRNWGTKWNVTKDDWSVVNEEVNGDRKMVRLFLLTAWCPPIAWLRAVAASYLYRPVTFTLAFLEEGERFSRGVEFWCEQTMERRTSGSFMGTDPFQAAAYRDALIEFDADAAITYTFIAEIVGARLSMSPLVSARYPSVSQGENALAPGDRGKTADLIRHSIHCTFDPTAVESAVDPLSRSFCDDMPAEDEGLQIEVEDVTIDRGSLVVSARAEFQVAFAVPFVSLQDFYDTCERMWSAEQRSSPVA